MFASMVIEIYIGMLILEIKYKKNFFLFSVIPLYRKYLISFVPAIFFNIYIYKILNN